MKFIFFTIALLACVVAIIGYLFVLGEISLSLSSIATTRGQVERAKQQETESRTAELFSVETKALQKELDDFIAHDADVVVVIETIELAAKRENVEVAIASVNPGSVKAWKYHEPVRAVVTAAGSFTSLAAFVAALETLPRVMHMEQLGMETVGREWYGTFELSFVKQKAISL